MGIDAIHRNVDSTSETRTLRGVITNGTRSVDTKTDEKTETNKGVQAENNKFYHL